jgi:hypothetical protein
MDEAKLKDIYDFIESKLKFKYPVDAMRSFASLFVYSIESLGSKLDNVSLGLKEISTEIKRAHTSSPTGPR